MMMISLQSTLENVNGILSLTTVQSNMLAMGALHNSWVYQPANVSQKQRQLLTLISRVETKKKSPLKKVDTSVKSIYPLLRFTSKHLAARGKQTEERSTESVSFTDFSRGRGLFFFLSCTEGGGKEERGVLFSRSDPKIPVLGWISMRPQRTLALPLHWKSKDKKS